MKVLDLSGPGDEPLFHGHDAIQFVTLRFPGGEEHIRLELEDFPEPVVIIVKLTSSADVMRLLLANDALQEAGYHDRTLYMPYVPYARQDRVTEDTHGEPLSARVFAGLINSCGFDAVFTIDNHSDVVTALIERCQNLEVQNIVADFVEPQLFPKENELYHIVSPDAGAMKKIYPVVTSLQHAIKDPIIGMKHRNMRTGEIDRTSIMAPGPLLGYPCLVVDDICDGGRTFIELAKVLKKEDCGPLYLYVTHGIFSNNALPRLLEYYDGIITTNSLPQDEKLAALKQKDSSRVVVVDILKGVIDGSN